MNITLLRARYDLKLLNFTALDNIKKDAFDLQKIVCFE